MKIKKAVCFTLAGAALTGTSALAKDNIYAYNKFISTVLGPQYGYCDFAASFAGHESEYDNVNDYFTGLISAFYDDIDGDFDNELITVDTHGVTVYQAEENGVVFLGSAPSELIADYGGSYANVFLVPEGRKKYVGIETYGKVVNEYHMYLFDLDPETDEFKKILDISRTDNEDGLAEKAWANDKTYYSFTNEGGFQTSINPDGYSGINDAAASAVTAAAPKMSGENPPISLEQRMKGAGVNDDYHISAYASAPEQKTYIRSTGLRLTDKPVVIFEDKSQLEELKAQPDIVTVMIDGQTMKFPYQDPMIVDDNGTYRTLVPMRTIFEALGADVDWSDNEGVQTITATTDTTTIEMEINKKSFTVNGVEKELDVPAQLINDTTMVPIRAISESLGCYVGWDQDAKTVLIQSQTNIENAAE